MVAPTPPVQRAIELTAACDVLSTYLSTADALADITGPADPDNEGDTQMGDEAARRKTVSVLLPREIDVTNSAQLCADLCAHAAGDADTVIADMTATGFCDSSGFRMLLVAQDRLAISAVQLTVVIPADGPVMRALKLIGFDQVLKISPAAVDATPA